MRVIAGQAKGKRLVAPKGTDTRPTLDRVREALFSILMPGLPQARFLDLYAGTGANGIEALSRDAAHATFVESDRRCLHAIQENLENTALAPNAQCLHGEAPGNLHLLKEPYDIIFADPPYAYNDYPAIVDALEKAHLIADGGLFILEHPSKAPVPEGGNLLKQTRQVRYGRTCLTFYA